MVRLTNEDMVATLENLNRATHDTQGYSYDKANGGWKLVRADGSIEVSTRLSRQAMYDWTWAYIYGIWAGRKIYPNNSRLLGD